MYEGVHCVAIFSGTSRPESKYFEYIIKHKADFVDAQKLFDNDLLIIPDIRYSYGERRSIGFGHLNNRLMCVVFTERHPSIIRIIFLRKANNREKKYYHSTIKN